MKNKQLTRSNWGVLGAYKVKSPLKKGQRMNIDINKVEWEDIFGNPVGTTEERYKRLAQQLEEYNKKQKEVS